MSYGGCVGVGRDGRVVDCLGHASFGVHHAALACHRAADASWCACAASLARFLVAYGRGKVHFEIRLLNTDGVLLAIGFDLQHCNFVDIVVVGKGEDVADCQAREVPERGFEHGFGVGDFEEVGVLRLKLDELAGRQIGALGLKEITGFEQESLHEPERQVAPSLFGGEL